MRSCASSPAAVWEVEKLAAGDQCRIESSRRFILTKLLIKPETPQCGDNHSRPGEPFVRGTNSAASMMWACGKVWDPRRPDRLGSICEKYDHPN